MDVIKVLDKEFVLYISKEKIQEEVSRVASEINRDYAGKSPVFLSVLNGSFMFTSDLLKHITLPCQVSFVKLASYQGTQSTGTINEVMGIGMDLTGRDVIIVEDIIESGITMTHMLEALKAHNPASVSICTFFHKPQQLKVPLDIRYIAMNIGPAFIIGYGLDYDGYARNLEEIYVLK